MGKYTWKNRITCLFKGHIHRTHIDFDSFGFMTRYITDYCERCDKILHIQKV